jgi:hypothetical protein
MANILFQQESYKRGMVLGLTMAEIVLLILFTLLLVLSALIMEKEREQSKLTAELSLAEKTLTEITNGQITDPHKFFRELEIAKQQAAKADKLEQQLQKANKKNAQLKSALDKERAARTAAERANGPSPAHKWPPIINLSEAEGYFFEVGSAELSDEFKAALVDVIEVIGHTDEQVIRRRYSNLDEALMDVVKTGNIASLVPADNAGLGISRAVAVVTRLLQDSRLQKQFSRILPMSGAQLIQVDDTLSQGAVGDVRERRRIEIRLRKYEKGGSDTVTSGGPSR